MMQPWETNAQSGQNRAKTGGARFAEDRLGGEKPVAFDGERAMSYLRKLCDLGPRISGSEGLKKQQGLLKEHFEKFGAKVELQRFDGRQRSRPNPVPMANLIARWWPERSRRIIICAHYDTRPIADKEPDPRLWRQPFLGANDGASGPAFLMEMAHHLGELPVAVGVDFVLFDAEEFIFDNTPSDRGGDEYFLGSEHFAREYTAARRRDSRHPTYVAAILVDMIAGMKPRFYYDEHSWARCGSLCEQIWGIAAEVKAAAFIPQVKHLVLDDHIPLQRARIPAIDIIDMDYPHWHRLTDVPASCAPDGMEHVAKVLVVWLQRVK